MEVELLLFTRNVVSSLLFFVVAGSLLGFQQFEPLSLGLFWLIILLYAFLVTGGRPTPAELLDAAVIILGVTITTFRPTRPESSSHDEALERK